jgi:hypothetical protein
MDEDQPYPLQDFNVRLHDIMTAMYEGPNPADWDVEHRFDVHLQRMLDPNGDYNVWLRIPLPNDLQQPYLGGISRRSRCSMQRSVPLPWQLTDS